MKTDSLDSFHSRLIDISIELGAIAESAAWASEGVARWLMERHPEKALNDLTIAEILAVVHDRADFCQRVYSPPPLFKAPRSPE